MSCGINETTIRESINQSIQQNLLATGSFALQETSLIPTDEATQSHLDEVNRTYGEDLISLKDGLVSIHPSQEFVDGYVELYSSEDMYRNVITEVQALSPTPQVSRVQLQKIEQLLDKMGVKIADLDTMLINGKQVGTNGIALPLQALVGYTQGHSEVLPEESFHIAVELLSQTHPGLLNKMFTTISKMEVYTQVLEKYSQLPQYQKNNKPDYQKLKKEAIGQQLAKQFNQTPEVKSWWDRAIDFLRGLFQKTQVDLNPFQESLNAIFRGKIGTVRNTLLKNKNYIVQQGIAPEIADKIISLASSDLTDESLRLMIAQLETGPEYFSLVEDTYVKIINHNPPVQAYQSYLTKITESLKKVYGDPTKNAFQTAFKEFSEQGETKVHKDIQNILQRNVDADGNLIPTSVPATSTNLSKAEYDILEDMIMGKIRTFPVPKILFNKDLSSTSLNLTSKADLIVVSEGKTHIFNFFTTDKPRLDNTTKKILNTQVSDVKNILQAEYNITSFGQVRNIPIQTEAGNLSMAPDTDEFMELPSILDQSDSKKMDALIRSLFSILNKTSKTSSDNRLSNQILKSIRDLQVKGDSASLERTMRSMIKRMDALDKEFLTKFKDIDITTISEDELADFSNRLDHVITLSAYFNNSVVDSLEEAIERSPELFKDAEKNLKFVQNAVDSLQGKRQRLISQNKAYISNTVGQETGIANLADPERPVGFIGSKVRSFSQALTKSSQALWKIVNTVKRSVESKVTREIPKIQALQKAYISKYGINLNNFLQPIAKKDKEGNYVHELLNKYDYDSFNAQYQEAVKNNDLAWVKKNIDTSAYNAWYTEAKRKTFQEYESTEYHFDEEENNRIINERKTSWEERFDITKNLDENNLKVKDFITDKHLSKEYKELKKDKPAFDLYNYLYDLNMQAHAAGALSRETAEKLIPFVNKNLTEKILTGVNPLKSGGFMESLFTTEELATMENIDPDTGKPEENLPFYFSRDISKERKDGSRDYSNVSQELFMMLPTYAKQVYTYEGLKKKESQIRLLSTLESTKGSLKTDKWGSVDREAGIITNNDKNLEYLMNFVKGAVYGQRDVNSTLDTKLFKVTGNLNKKINSLLGTNLPTYEDGAKHVTINNAVDFINKTFTLKVLGLNIAIPIANFTGSNLQVLINQTNLFRKRDFLKHEFSSMLNKFKSEEERLKTIGLVEYLNLFYDNETAQRFERRLAVNAFNRKTIPEVLMEIQSQSEIPLQIGIGLSMLENTIVEDGNLLNISEYLSEKYSNRFDLSQTERKEIDEKMKQEAETLRERSVLKIVEIKDGELNIPGVERDSETVYDFVARVQGVTKRATGGGNRDDFRQINQTLVGRSVMVFKSWMPQLIMNRVDGLRYNIGVDNYEMGRYNAIAQVLQKRSLKGMQTLYDVSTLNDRGVTFLKEHYDDTKARFQEKTGEELRMTETEFIEMYKGLIDSSFKDVLALLTVTGMFLGFAAMEPPEDPQDRSAYMYTYKLISKFQQEMLFYYNPHETIGLTKSLFPSVGLISEGLGVLGEAGKTINYLVTQDEELEKKTHLFKKTMKILPVASQALPLFAIIAPELAKELGVENKKPTSFR